MWFKQYSDVRAVGDWEWNWIGEKYNLRIGRSQFAFWINYEPIFNFLYGFNGKHNPARVSTVD